MTTSKQKQKTERDPRGRKGQRPETEVPGDIKLLRLDVCETDPDNFRTLLDEAKIGELARTIRENGVQENCVAYFEESSGKYRFIDGNRRLVASVRVLEELNQKKEAPKNWRHRKKANDLIERIEMIPARILTDEEEIREAKLLQLMLNLQSEPLDSIEQGKAAFWLIENYGLSSAEVARRVGVSSQAVTNWLNLLRCPEVLLDAFRDPETKVFQKHCEKVASIPGPVERETCALQVLNPKYKDGEPLTVSETEELIAREYKRDLSAAAWDMLDETLVPEAGSCSGCLFRSGNIGEVTDRAKGRGGKGLWVCTKTSCFKRKREAWIERRSELDEGVEVVSTLESSKVFGGPGGSSTFDSPFAKVEEKPTSKETGHHDPAKVDTWRKLIETADEGLADVVERRKRELIDRGKSFGLTIKESLGEVLSDRVKGLPGETREELEILRKFYEEGRSALEMVIPVAVAYHPVTAAKVEVVNRERAAEVIDLKRKAVEGTSPFENRRSPGEDRRERQKESREDKKGIEARGIELAEAIARKVAEDGSDRLRDLLTALLAVILEEDEDAEIVLRGFLPLEGVKLEEGETFASVVIDFILAEPDRPVAHVAGYLTAAVLAPFLRWEADSSPHVQAIASAFKVKVRPEGGAV